MVRMTKHLHAVLAKSCSSVVILTHQKNFNRAITVLFHRHIKFCGWTRHWSAVREIPGHVAVEFQQQLLVVILPCLSGKHIVSLLKPTTAAFLHMSPKDTILSQFLSM
jgi:hypothetical protein